MCWVCIRGQMKGIKTIDSSQMSQGLCKSKKLIYSLILIRGVARACWGVAPIGSGNIKVSIHELRLA